MDVSVRVVFHQRADAGCLALRCADERACDLPVTGITLRRHCPGLRRGHIMAVMADLAPIAERYLRFAAAEARRGSPTFEAWSLAGTGLSRTTANTDVTRPESGT